MAGLSAPDGAAGIADLPPHPAAPDVVYGWSMAVSWARGHYVRIGAPVHTYNDRPVAEGICSDFLAHLGQAATWTSAPAYVDQDSHTLAQIARRCHLCVARLLGRCLRCLGTGRLNKAEPVEPGVIGYRETDCPDCDGSGKLPPIDGVTGADL